MKPLHYIEYIYNVGNSLKLIFSVWYILTYFIIPEAPTILQDVSNNLSAIMKWYINPFGTEVEMYRKN